MPHIELFMKLFSGRNDVFGLNQCCIKEKLTPEIYKEHIEGKQRIGVYPIHDKNLTKWIAYDIDIEDFNLALSIKQKAENLNLHINLERSKSKGYHGWCVFDQPVEAVKARLVFESILEELDVKCEVFPKQDTVAEGQYGNFIFLPLFGGSVPEGRTVFVNDNNQIIIENVNKLSEIKLTPAKYLDAIIFMRKLERRKTIIEETAPGESSQDKRTFSRELPCIEKMKLGVGKGHRDNVCLRLVINYKEKGMSRGDIETLINNWNLKNAEPLADKDLVKVINSVFKGGYKSYGCEDAIIQNYCNKDNCPLIQSQDKKDLIEKGIITMVFRDTEVMVFRKKNYEYRFSNFEFTKSGKFKASLTLSRDKKIIFKDVIKLDMAANRKRFCVAADDEEIDIDLIKLEDLVKKQIEKEEHEKLMAPKQLYIMTEQEKNETIKFFESTPDILFKAIEVTNRMGVVGDETLRLMVYLCYTSRILKDPLSITVKGESSSGKSFSCQNVQRLIPEEGYHFITRATANAFYHLQEDGMQHRIIYINELPGSEGADYSIRTAQSEGDLILMMPIKDPATGDMETVTKRVKGPVGFLITTTKAQMFDENETRNFSVFSDDSPGLTHSIGDITVRKALGEEFKIDEKELNLWKNIQRLLNPDFKVIIPYAKEVFGSFPSKPVRIRRDRERFRVLIEIITIIHQYHREQKKAADGHIHLISTLADYYIAKIVAEKILTYTIYEVGPAAEDLWKTINTMKANFHPEHYVSADFGSPEGHVKDEIEFNFKHRDVAEYMDWKVEKVKKWMYTLLHAGLIDYVDKSGGGKGKAAIFRISKQGLSWSSDSLGFLPKIEDLYQKYPCDNSLFYNAITGASVNPISASAPEGLLEGIEDEGGN